MMQLRKGVINFVDNAGAKMQTAQIEGIAGELANGVENYQPFGFTSHVVPCDPVTGEGAEIILGDLGSASQRTILACSDRRYRPVVTNVGDVILSGIADLTTAATHDLATQRLAFTNDGTDQYRLIAKVNHTLIQQKSDDTITLSNAHATVIIAADGTMSITAPTLNITSNVNITGNLTVSGNVTNASKNISKTHTHTGVTTGSGTTGQVS
jgi:phage gp45-like